MISLVSKRLKAWHLVFSFFVLYVLLAIRLPIWIDEAFTIQQSSLPLGSLIKDCLTKLDAVHLVYYVICWLIGVAFDQSLLALRLLSILATLGTLRNLFYVMSLKFDRTTSLIAISIFGILPVTIDFATQARSSSLVTFLFSCTVLIAIKSEGNFQNPQLIQFLFLSTLFVCVNFLSLVGYIIVLLYIFAKNKVFFKSLKHRASLIIPFVAAIPFVLLGQHQKSQIQWIGSESSFQEMVNKFWFWPIQGDDRVAGKAIVCFMVLSIASIAVSRKIVDSLQSQKLVVVFLSSIAVLPPLILLVASLVQPIFLTRYFAYSGLGVSALIALFLSMHQSNAFRLGYIAALLALCIANVSALSMNRDGQVDWIRVATEVSQGPTSATILLDPTWSTPLARYYLTDDESIRIVGGIFDLKILAKGDCRVLPHNVWFISAFMETSVQDFEEMNLLGYKSESKAGSAGPILFSLDNCK